MTTEFQHLVTTAIITHDGNAFEIEAGAVWSVDDRDDYTQVALTDCDDARLNGLTICVDWSQGIVRPDALDHRILAIVADPNLLATHIGHHAAV